MPPRTLAGSRERWLRRAFWLLLLGVGVGGHAILLQRIVWAPQWPSPGRQLGTLAVAAGLGLTWLQLRGRRRRSAAASRLQAWAAHLWLGFAFLLLATTLASEALAWVLGAAPTHGQPLQAERLRAGAALATAAVAAAFALRNALSPPRIRRLEVRLPRWPRGLDGFRIVQLSDLHIGTLLGRRFAERLRERVTRLQPDLVAITGDVVDGSPTRLEAEVAPLGALRAPQGVYFVTGNHDTYSGAGAWAAVWRRFGWRVLRNERVRVRAGADSFELAGVDDHRSAWVDPQSGEDLDAALSGRDRSRALLLLAHDPATFHGASRYGVDLQLSGHTHGGQLWPFHAVVRVFGPWLAGLYRVGESLLYVSRGTGFWGPPMRLLAPAEITEIVLRAAASPTPRD